MRFSLNNTVPEPERYAEWQGFNNVPPAPSSGIPQGQGALTQPHPFVDAVVDHSNTTLMDVPSGTPGARRITEQL